MPKLLSGIRKKADRNHAKAWLRSFSAYSDETKIVGVNWRDDPNISPVAAKQIAASLKSTWRGGSPPHHAIGSCVDAKLACDAVNRVSVPSSLLSRIMPVEKLIKYHINAHGAFTAGVPTTGMADFLRDLEPRNFFGRVQGGRPYGWATDAHSVRSIPSADELRDKLGLNFTLCPPGTPVDEACYGETLVELIFQSDIPPSLHRPTVVEALSEARFKPSKKNSNAGLTVNLADGSPGVLEWVFPSFLANQLTAPPQYRGRVTRNPPSVWISTRLM